MGMFATEEEMRTFLKGSHVKVHGEIAPVTAVSVSGIKVPRAPTKKQAAKRSKIEQQMANLIDLYHFPKPFDQYRPFPERNVKIDFAWPDIKLGLEVDGGAHSTRANFMGSFERKFNLLICGWTMLHVGEEEVRSGLAAEWLKQVLQKLGAIVEQQQERSK